MRFMLGRYAALVLGACWAVAALGNNMRVTNTTVAAYQPDAGLAQIRFDISWENSWRYTNINHDAAWVFFKVQKEGDVSNNWTRVKLAGTGTNPAGYSTGTGTGIELIVPEDGMGVFVRRATEGSGAVSVTNARVVWNFDLATNGLTRTSKAKIQTLAIEMVYVAEGSFYVGSGGTESGSFTDGAWTSGTTMPFRITSEAAMTITNAAGYLWGTSSIGGAGTLSNAYPKGYNAFYCMKYEITQGQYTDFLNLLTYTQAINRYSSSSTGSRYTIGTNTFGQYTNGAPDRACNYLSWADGAALADWSGLRPLSELEFEKACRGTNAPLAGEFAWGSASISATTAIINDGTGTDTATGGNCNYSVSVPDGPYRVGIYATASSTRESAGASYWGIMELSGSVWERSVTVGNATGRGFTGQHGDGTLNANGDADVTNWPGTTANGAGFRGGSWPDTSVGVRVSDRTDAASVSAGRSNSRGWRGGRSTPSGVSP